MVLVFAYCYFSSHFALSFRYSFVWFFMFFVKSVLSTCLYCSMPPTLVSLHNIEMFMERNKLKRKEGVEKNRKGWRVKKMRVMVHLFFVILDDICTEFNELRSEMVLLYEIKNALTTCKHHIIQNTIKNVKGSPWILNGGMCSNL